MDESLGIRIKRLRENKGKTQAQLAAYLHLNRKAIGSYEHDEREPSLDSIILLAKYFQVSTDYLLGMGKYRVIHANGLTEREYLLIKELVAIIAENHKK